MRILIVGGGIAGSTLAFALRRAGASAVVVEARQSERNAGGAFLALAPNGISALRAIGLDDVPTAAGGFPVSGLDFHNARGRRIAELAAERDAERYGSQSMVLRRASLQAELAERAQAAGARFLFDARLVELRARADGIEAVLADGHTRTVDAVIGADGIWSTVRRLTWPNAPRPSYTGIVDCGGWTEVDLPDTARQQMHFGHRAFFGYTVANGLAYWFTNVPYPDEPGRAEFDELKQDEWMISIRELHDHDSAQVRSILQATEHSLGAWPVYDMPDLESWNTNRVCLIGDAAHAVSPSSGQGASLAIEDAAVLASWIASATNPADAFAAFTRERKARVHKIAKFGRQIGDRKISSASASNLFRDVTLGMFLRMGAKGTAEQFGYRVPPVPARNAVDEAR